MIKTITQADRDGYAALYLQDQGEPHSCHDLSTAAEIQIGKHDDWNGVQAFARHRCDFEEGLRIDLARVMDKHVTNWPEYQFRKVKTALLLLDKTLHNALINSFEDFVEPFEVVSSTPRTETVNVYDELVAASKALREDALYNQYDCKVSRTIWQRFNAALADFEDKK
jgi:hypothetical protein